MATRASGDTVIVGRILGPWGVQGWVRVYSWTDPPTAVFEYRPWLLGEQQQATEVLEWRRSGQRLVAQLHTVDSPEAAAALSEQLIRVSRSLLPDPEPGSYYWHDLIGLDVVNLERYAWGSIERILPTGAHDVMEIAHAQRGKILIPFVQPDVVRSVDLEAGQVVVDWPEDWVD